MVYSLGRSALGLDHAVVVSQDDEAFGQMSRYLAVDAAGLRRWHFVVRRQDVVHPEFASTVIHLLLDENSWCSKCSDAMFDACTRLQQLRLGYGVAHCNSQWSDCQTCC